MMPVTGRMGRPVIRTKEWITMKKLMAVPADFLALLFALTACGVSAAQFEEVQASSAALDSEKQELQAQLDTVTAELDAAEAEAKKLREADEQRQAEAKAEEERKAKEKAEQEEEKAKQEAAKKAEKEKANKAKKISKRELAQIVKKPDSYVDKNVIIYARVTQFDAATGLCAFRADVAHAHVGKYDFEHNSYFTAGDGIADCSILDDVLAEDIVQLTATVSGALSYDTQIGGSTTVPQFQVVKIKRL
ncbi:hypothetical protein [Glutamicibacter sp. AOP3-A1-12]|uniref:hypothetical protein n=1 Tax=Glutamicibacter sp. AOP3-A1-12 TaxID=3457701 RepID=UPI004034F3A7